VARWFSIRPAITVRGRRFFGLRGWAGKPTHPPLTDFPIVCYVLAGVFDLVSFVAWRSKGAGSSVPGDAFVAATWVIVSGAVVSVATVLTGFMDWWKGIPRRHTGPIGRARRTQVWRTINWHLSVMVTVTVLVIADIVVRLAHYHRHHAELATMVLSVIAGALVAYGATYGGSLVFDHQFNVVELTNSTAWEETEEDQLPGAKEPPREG
jgi:uncharacterized membrane protein